jgi:hypothetical protein
VRRPAARSPVFMYSLSARRIPDRGAAGSTSGWSGAGGS